MGINVKTLSAEYDFVIESASYIGRPLNNTVMYVSKKVELLIHNLSTSKHCLIFAEETVCVPESLKADNCFVFSANPQLDYAMFVQKLKKERESKDEVRKYRLTSEGYYLGENTSIGKNAVIAPLCFIGHDVIIGENAVVLSGARVMNALIGDNFKAGENCTIGTEGFTMTVDENGNRIRIPTLGKVSIGNNVEIGALANVSCGSAGNTVIEDYVKIDSFVHIGHDAHLSRNVEIPAGAIMGGFDDLGENAYVGINATLRNRITIGRNAIVGMGAVVTKNIVDNTTVVGNPAKPFEKKESK